MENQKLKVGITHGDINGISYEIIIKTFGGPSKITELFTPILYGSSKVLSYYRNVFEIKHLKSNISQEDNNFDTQQLNVVNCIEGEVKVEMGQSTIAAGDCSIKALDRAINDLKEGIIDVLVTAPLNKENVKKCLPNFSGHTEYLQEKFGSDEVLMMMVKDGLRVAVATTHIPVADISQSITPELLTDKVRLFNQSLLQDFSIRKGRIAVLGLNPHSGDNGAIGTEDRDIIAPTLEKLREEGINAYGPFPADGFFGSGEYLKYDAILAMYHDQGLIPFKLIAKGGGVNFTAGLPIVRTSAAHGTAYGIAGKNVADESSLREAIYLASDIYKNRKIYDEISKSPLVIEEKNNKYSKNDKREYKQ